MRYPCTDVPWSGPITTPREQECEAIRRAPAYDMAAARAYLDVMPRLRALTEGLRDAEEPIAFGPATPGAIAFERLRREIGRLCGGGHKVSLIMADAATQSGVAFRSAERMCTQSTVKAIYVGAVLESRPQALAENGQYMRDAIVLSSNLAYERLRAIYGKAPIRAWCREAGVDERFADPDYPRDKTARDMFLLWTRLYRFLNGGADRENFAAYYAGSVASAARERLGGRYPVQTKAGWENGLDESRDYDPAAPIPARFTDGDPLNDECAINDTGIVYTPRGPYLFVIYTDHPFGIFRNYTTPNPLLRVTEALCEVQKSLEA